MSRPFRLAAAPIAALAILTTAAFAQGSAGTITGTLGLDDAVWYVAEGAEDQASTWSEGETGRAFRLVGLPRPEGDTPRDRLVIEFIAAGNPTEPVVEGATVTFRPAGSDTPFRASGENVDLSLTAVASEGDDVAVSGNVVAVMTPGGAGGLVVEPDESMLNFDGNFQATLVKDQ